MQKEKKYFDDGSFYDGTFVEGKMHGYGMLFQFNLSIQLFSGKKVFGP